MAQLAEQLHNVAPGYVDHPAVDETGLSGAFDFGFTWSPRGAIDGGGKGRDGSGGAPANSDPTGGITFFSALERQLGLHLEGGQKRPQTVLMVDKIDHLNANN